MNTGITAIVPAHDEAGCIAATVSNLRAAQPAPATVVVIADHCSDATAAQARAAGGIVWERQDGPAGKGAALSWFLTSENASLPSSLFVAVFDADSSVCGDFFAAMQSVLESGVRVAQGFVQPTGYAGSAVATLAAYSELLSQLVDDRCRTWLRWPVPLRGTGMAFETRLLRELLAHVSSRTEDIELSLLLAEQGEPVRFVPAAIVFDPKPADAERVARQRARWLQGQSQVWRHHGRRLIRLLGRGPGTWSLLATLLLKPKALIAVLELAGAVGSWLLPAPGWLRWLLTWLAASQAMYYLGGLALVPRVERARFAAALLSAPLYGVMWLRSAAVALRNRSDWLSVRHQ